MISGKKRLFCFFATWFLLHLFFTPPAYGVVPKKGIALTGGSNLQLQLNMIGAVWGYNWDINIPESPLYYLYGYTHIPMIRGRADLRPTDQQIIDFAQAHPGSYWLIWNEPDRDDQDNISAAEGAQQYWHIRPLLKGVDPNAKLIVGGVMNLNYTWLANFREEYKNLSANTSHQYPVVEGWAVHMYTGFHDTYDAANWQWALKGFFCDRWMPANGGTVQVWLTEWGCLDCWTAEGDARMAQMISDQVPWLESQSCITRYAWFGSWTLAWNMTGELFDHSDGLTSLGQLYASLGNPPIPTATPTPRISPTPTLPPCLSGNLGNLDCDLGGLIDETDLSILLGSWAPFGPVPTPASGRHSADISPTGGDGKVDSSDISTLLSNWHP